MKTLGPVTLIFLAVVARLPAPSQSNPSATPHVVLVRLDTRGLTLSDSTMKPGLTRLLLVNMTPLVAPELQIQEIKTGISKPAAIPDKPKDSDRGKRSWSDFVATPGSYQLQLKSAPRVAVDFTVAP